MTLASALCAPLHESGVRLMRTTGDLRVRWARLLSSSLVWERTLATRAYPYAPRVGAYMCPVGLTDGRCVHRDLRA